MSTTAIFEEETLSARRPDALSLHNGDFKIQRRRRQLERQKKIIGSISKTTTSHVHHTFFVYISFPFLRDYDVKMPNFTFYRGRKQATTKFYFSFRAWIWSLEIQLRGGFAYICQSKWLGIIAIKTEKTQIHFLSDVHLAFASLDLKVPNRGRFLVLRKPLLVRFCFLMWVLLSAFSICCKTSFGDCTVRQDSHDTVTVENSYV